MTDPAAPAESAPLPKADPEALVLRGAPRRVARFRRGVIIAVAALGSTGIAGVTWLALKPAAFTTLADSGRSSEPAGRRTPDALAMAPTSYSDVPQLGPPLPGDLGRPILDHQRSIGAAPQPGAEADAAQRAEQAAEAERQRIAAEGKAARESGVMVQTAAAGPRTESASTPSAGASAPAPAAEPGKQLALDPARDPGSQQRKPDVPSGSDVNPHTLVPAASPNMLSAGSIIAASLITGLNSDLPGLVTAQVTENAYDSVTGRTLLIPQGSRLVGSYDSVVAFGQQRALVVWQRVILPDGSSVRIDNWLASDLQGYAGLADRIDRHTWQLLKGVALSTLLGVGTEIDFAGESDLVEAIRESAQQSGARAGDQLVRKNLDVKPTIRVRPGWPLTVVVNKDLVLPPWKGM
ncbi:MAG: TrbI/VirB10 family protein [Sphingomonas sp.]